MKRERDSSDSDDDDVVLLGVKKPKLCHESLKSALKFRDSTFHISSDTGGMVNSTGMSCPACTFINAMHARVCEMCRTKLSKSDKCAICRLFKSIRGCYDGFCKALSPSEQTLIKSTNDAGMIGTLLEIAAGSASLQHVFCASGVAALIGENPRRKQKSAFFEAISRQVTRLHCFSLSAVVHTAIRLLQYILVTVG